MASERLKGAHAAIAGIIELWDYRNDDGALPSGFRNSIMRCSRLTGSTVAVLFAAAAIGLASGSAAALPAGGLNEAAQVVAPIMERAAHKHQQWYWHNGWWRHGPWSNHVIRGMVHTRPSVVFVPWGAERLRRCAAKYRSFDPATGTYASRGKRRICR